MLYKEYTDRVKGKSMPRFWAGLLVRLYNRSCAEFNRQIALFRGAKIGCDTYITLKMALKANRNLTIGQSSIIETTDLDLRDKIEIGSRVIINKGVQILRASHELDSTLFRTVSAGLKIEDSAWIATKALILPGCTQIAEGVVIAAGAVVAKSASLPSGIYAGNPAKHVKNRGCIYTDLIVESLQGRDLKQYYYARFGKK